MKHHLIILVILLIMPSAFFACATNVPNGQTTEVSEETQNNQATNILDVATDNASNETSTEIPSENISSHRTREIHRDGDYKTMEMYVNEDGYFSSFTRRITFEVPVEWEGTTQVLRYSEDDSFFETGFSDGELFVMKVDMWTIESATREKLLNAFENRAGDDLYERVDENIYLTEHYEIFYYKEMLKDRGVYIDASTSFYYYALYANGERFLLFGYVFGEDRPENDGIFRRIVESIRFQF